MRHKVVHSKFDTHAQTVAKKGQSIEHYANHKDLQMKFKISSIVQVHNGMTDVAFLDSQRVEHCDLGKKKKPNLSHARVS